MLARITWIHIGLLGLGRPGPRHSHPLTQSEEDMHHITMKTCRRLIARSAIVACSLLGLTSTASASGVALDNAANPDALQALDLHAGQALNLALPSGQAWEAFSVDVTIDGQPMTLDFFPHSLRADDFMLEIVGENGVRQAIAPPAETSYRGEIRGVEGSYVAGTLYQGELRALIQRPGLPTMWIDPSPIGPVTSHVLYANTDAKDLGKKCGVPNDLAIPMPALKQMAPPAGSPDMFLICEMGIDTDFEYYQKNSSSVTNTVNDITTIMNNVGTIYKADANVDFRITHFIIRTSATGQPYTSTSPNTLLTQFDNEWSSNNSGIRRDLAHLFTGKNLSGGVIGIAYLSGVCSTNIGYGLSESRFTLNVTQRTALTAHEVGHNFSANHCNQSPTVCSPCTIMCASIGGCASPLTTFACSSTVITNYAAGRVCLNDANTAPSPLPIPFTDTFLAPATDTKLWTVNFGVSNSAGGTGEPSPSLAMNLDNKDSIITVWLNTKAPAVTPIFVSFYWQTLNVPAGQQLLVEYYNVFTNVFNPLMTIDSPGTPQTNFVFAEAALPANGVSDIRSRLRFSVNGNLALEDWFVDNVSVSIYCRTDINQDRTLSINDFIDFQTAFAIGDVLTADFTDDGGLSIDDFITFQTFYALGCY
jgi:Metallo-peptidase family M12